MAEELAGYTFAHGRKGMAEEGAAMLAPCPFCGAPGRQDNGFLPMESVVYAFCSNLECGLAHETIFSPDEWNTRASPAPDPVRTALAERLQAFQDHFWIHCPQMAWKRTTCDDGLEMVHHGGDTIFFGDANHQEPNDIERFDLIVELANSVPQIIAALRAQGSGTFPLGLGTPSDADWQRALDCAGDVMEGYYSKPHISTKAGRRAALDDAMQHAFGMLSLSLPAEGGAREGWQPIETAPKDGTRVLVFEGHVVRTVTGARWLGSPHDVWIADNGSYLRRASHWQPLPAYPISRPHSHTPEK